MAVVTAAKRNEPAMASMPGTAGTNGIGA
jgi:hypothetical protein